MAQRIQTSFIDDIDGGAADGTVRFGLDGTDYEIDLSGEHTDELRKRAREVRSSTAARSAAPPAARHGACAPLPPSTPPRSANGRRGNGYDIKDRGRVPAELVAKYQESSGA